MRENSPRGRWVCKSRGGGRRRRRQLRQVGVDSKKVDGGGGDGGSGGIDDDDDVEERERVGARQGTTRRTTLINIHDEIYPSIITGPEIYARSAVSDKGSTARATAPRLNPPRVY